MTSYLFTIILSIICRVQHGAFNLVRKRRIILYNSPQKVHGMDVLVRDIQDIWGFVCIHVCAYVYACAYVLRYWHAHMWYVCVGECVIVILSVILTLPPYFLYDIYIIHCGKTLLCTMMYICDRPCSSWLLKKMNGTWLNIYSGNGSVLSGRKPYPPPILTLILDASQRHHGLFYQKKWAKPSMGLGHLQVIHPRKTVEFNYSSMTLFQRRFS